MAKHKPTIGKKFLGKADPERGKAEILQRDHLGALQKSEIDLSGLMKNAGSDEGKLARAIRKEHGLHRVLAHELATTVLRL